MNEDTNLQRLIYYKGQLLTAQDFEDQQKYHKQKLEQLTERFPTGIVRGLKVIFSKNSDGSEALKILGGLAIDSDGKAIVIPEEGILVPLPNGLEKPFLSLKYTESKSRRNLSPLEPTKPFDRIVETVESVWGKNANISDEEEACITVAKLRAKTEADKTLPAEVLSSNYVIEGQGDPTIRLDASLIGTDQIKDKAITTDKIDDGAVTSKNLADEVEARPKGPAGGDLDGDYPDPIVKVGAITSAKIADWDKDNNSETTGIKTEHIRDGAVTTEKLASALEARPKSNSVVSDKIAVWQAGSDPETGVKTAHLQDGAVESAKIAVWDNHPDATSKTGITTDHIRDGAVTHNKLNVAKKSGAGDQTLAAGATTSSPINVTAKLTEIIQLLPIEDGGPLSWTSTVSRSGDTLTYHVTVKNESTSAAKFRIHTINLGRATE